MADTSRTYLAMKFKNAAGADYTISVPYPKAEITTLEIETAMALIVTKDIILTSGGALVTAIDAGIITRTFTDMIE